MNVRWRLPLPGCFWPRRFRWNPALAGKPARYGLAVVLLIAGGFIVRGGYIGSLGPVVVPFGAYVLACGTIVFSSGLIRFLLTEIHLSFLRSELDRRQKGDDWSADGTLPLSVNLAMALWMGSSSWIYWATTTYLLTLLGLSLTGGSHQQLMRQIQRFTPRSGDSNGRPEDADASQLDRAGAGALWNTIPLLSAGTTRLGAVLAGLWWENARSIVRLAVLPTMVDTLSSIIAGAGLWMVLIFLGIILSKAAPLTLSVMLQAHLSGQQGQRLAILRELAAGCTWMSICLGLLGPESVRSASSAIALLGLVWINAAYDVVTLETYLRRMRQLR